MKNLVTVILLLYVSISFSQYNYGLEVEQHDAKIEGKLDLYSGGNSIFIGKNTGISDDGTDNGAIFIGEAAGANFMSGNGNIFIGSAAGLSTTNAFNNVFIGRESGLSNTEGHSNVYLGTFTGTKNTTGDLNVCIGQQAGKNNESGSFNVYVGYDAGRKNTDGTSNVFIGSNAGRDELGSSKLYIENSNSLTPLIYGEFTNDRVGIDWDSSISLPATLSINGTLHISETAKLEPMAGPPSSCTTAAEYGLMYYDSSVTPNKLKVCTDTGWNDLN